MGKKEKEPEGEKGAEKKPEGEPKEAPPSKPKVTQIDKHQFKGDTDDEKDVDEMAKSMIRLLKNKKEGQTMGERARKRIIENYTMSHHIKRIDTVLEQAILQSK